MRFLFHSLLERVGEGGRDSFKIESPRLRGWKYLDVDGHWVGGLDDSSIEVQLKDCSYE